MSNWKRLSDCSATASVYVVILGAPPKLWRAVLHGLGHFSLAIFRRATFRQSERGVELAERRGGSEFTDNTGA